ncbi:universal stress protein [Rhodovulum sp. DZ06]|uniref:universal stress protein n=1 Tax=Rhodovulum sp. DZ06 TaxID=3425126 RepID=UPI003D341F94
MTDTKAAGLETGKVVAMIDGSIYSESVTDHAAWAAARIGRPLELLHVIGPREGNHGREDRSGAIGLGARSALLEELAELDAQRGKLAQQRGRMILDHAVSRAAEAGAEATAKLRAGDIVEELVSVEADARVIVIGKRGEAADFAKGHLGSNMERVVRAAKCPVLVSSRAFKPVGSCLIAFDGGASALKAVDMAARSPFFEGMKIHLLSVGPESAEAKRKLDGARAMLSAAGHEITAGIQPGQPEEVIAGYIEREGIDLLVMGAYGHSRIRSLIIGSTTTEMVRSCTVPVLLFR